MVNKDNTIRKAASRLLDIFPYIDAHAHPGIEYEGTITVINKMPEDEIKKDSAYYSCGLHPWNVNPDTYKMLLGNLEQKASEGVLAAIGETGLDRVCSSPFELQQKVFLKHLELAEQYTLPVIVHCVRAFPECTRLIKKASNPGKVLFHGFNAGPRLFRELNSEGYKFSFGRAIFNNPGVREVFVNAPLDCIFLETDDSDLSLEELYQEAAKLKNMSPGLLREKLYQNFESFFILGKWRKP